MSERQQLPMVHFDDQGELSAAHAAAKRLIENIAALEVLPFEAEKNLVRAAHNDVYTKIWGPREDHARPIEISTDGRKA